MKTVIFASDIDKTLTDDRHIIPDEVANYLALRNQEGWKILLLTGRTFSFAMMSLEKLNFDFVLGVQNGAEVLLMPEKTIIFQNFLDKETVLAIDQIYQEFEEDFLIYSGLEKGDFCFYRRNRFSIYLLTYLEKLKKLSPADWVEINEIEDIPDAGFPLIKGIGKREVLEKISDKLSSFKEITNSLIKDTVDPSLSILLITKKGVDKGFILEKIGSSYSGNIVKIAAGDDLNDLSLLKKADIKIAMSTGPKNLIETATIVAKPSNQNGIIEALEQARKLDPLL
jgi:HAD superfamily hydrolase (TIGR01484 family)